MLNKKEEIEIEKLKNEIDKATQFLIQRDLELTLANKKLKEINDSKSEFISMAAHQLRTPISTISWYSEILNSETFGKLNEKQKEYSDNIHSSSIRISKLIETLLGISQLELGKNIVKYSKFNIKDRILKEIKHYEVELKNNRQTFSVDKVKDFEINFDSSLFGIIIGNIFSNAIKYGSKKSEIIVEAKILKKGEEVDERKFENDKILLKVSDNGFGIPKKSKRKIFTKLYRSENVVDKKIKGTGLGLYLIKLILDKTGGEIWFESEENKKTIFYVVLPIL